MCTYAVIVFGALSRVMPVMTLLALIPLPLVQRSIVTLKKYFEKPQGLAPANLDMIMAHSLTSFGLIIGYSIAGIVGGSDTIQLSMILLILTAAYFPALFAMRKPRKRDLSDSRKHLLFVKR
jgi:hypothetical protein